MTLNELLYSSWYPELQSDIEESLKKLSGGDSDQSLPLHRELLTISEKIKGWKLSLADPDLPHSVRKEIYDEFEQANTREQELKAEIELCQNRQQFQKQILDPARVLDSLNRLEKVLAGDNATLGNLELSLHIESIVCFNDGHVKMKVCRLGALPECVEVMKNQYSESVDSTQDNLLRHKQTGKIKPRRRAKLRTGSIGPEAEELDAAVTFATDPHRFSALGEEWFDEYEFDVPVKMGWYQKHAEKVFQRRQETKYPYSKLAVEFGVTRPTIRAAVKYYLETHPEATDNVVLKCGGTRPLKYEVEKFGHEAKLLWNAGWSKLKLAEKFGCSPPVIDKALKWSYAQEGLPLPSKQDRENQARVTARALHDEGCSLDEISRKMNVSDVTVRRLLKKSFEAEGKSMPDRRFKNSTEDND